MAKNARVCARAQMWMDRAGGFSCRCRSLGRSGRASRCRHLHDRKNLLGGFFPVRLYPLPGGSERRLHGGLQIAVRWLPEDRRIRRARLPGQNADQEITRKTALPIAAIACRTGAPPRKKTATCRNKRNATKPS